MVLRSLNTFVPPRSIGINNTLKPLRSNNSGLAPPCSPGLTTSKPLDSEASAIEVDGN